MNINIRQEVSADHPHVFKLIEEAFRDDEISDHREQYLVEGLRKSDAFIPELSLVAELDGELAGYILLSRIWIKKGDIAFPSLAMAPVAVLPPYQKMGIGGKLILRVHEIASKLGHDSVVLLGHENYYPKFGYKPAKEFGIKLPFDVPDENCMAIELVENGLKGISGLVEYPKEFFE